MIVLFTANPFGPALQNYVDRSPFDALALLVLVPLTIGGTAVATAWALARIYS